MELEELLMKIRRKKRAVTRRNIQVGNQKLLELLRSKRGKSHVPKNYLDPNKANWIIMQVRGRNRQQITYPTLDIDGIDCEYQVLVSDDTVKNPFVISPNLVRIIKQHIRDNATKEERAKTIYDWIEKNISYGDLRRYRGYSNTREVLQNKEGVCGEMAFLYIAMARVVGLVANYASIEIDCFNKKVSHGCAEVDRSKRKILVDPAYHRYDVKHKAYEILSDNEVMLRFSQWRER